MGVYIKNATNQQVMKVIMNSTEWLPDDVEFIEVHTPHGDLIDGNKMEFRKEDREDGGETWLWKAETIIPAEVN
jgi:hypothetical protein